VFCSRSYPISSVARTQDSQAMLGHNCEHAGPPPWSISEFSWPGQYSLHHHGEKQRWFGYLFSYDHTLLAINGVKLGHGFEVRPSARTKW